MVSTPRSPAVAQLTELARESGLRRVHMLAWRDLADVEAGGSELHAATIARIWAEAGVEVTMRASYAQGHPPEGTRDGYKVIRRRGRYMIFPAAVLAELRGLHGPRDGLVEIWNGVPFLSPVWARGPKITLVHHVHREMWRMVLEERLAKVGETLESRVLPPLYRRTPIVTLSESSRQELITHMRFKPDQVRVVPPGIDGAFTPGRKKSDHPLVVAVGRLMPSKRFDDLIRIAAEVRQQVPDLELVIVGDGYERPDLEALIDSLDAREWITLAGRVSDAELLRLYRRAWAVASASIAEGWGMTLTEAAACGTPAVATRIAGHSDSVSDGHSGLLAGSHREFVQHLTTLLTDTEQRAALTKGAKDFAATFHWDATALGVFAPLAEVALRRQGAGAATPVTDTVTTDDRDRPSNRSDADGGGALTERPPRATGWRRWGDVLVIAIPALLAYVPLVFTAMGQVGADTKTYLYLDPGKLMRDAPYVWDSQIGLGTVTHQNIGYLWPMGPFYWVMDAVGVPDWLAQRLWLGTVLFAAAMGVRYLLRTVDPDGLARRRGGLLVAVLAYMLSPYLLDYSARISVLLLPWAALPWMIALTAKALRRGGWRYPALFALVVVTVGGINATALIMVGFGPLLWVVHAVWFSREVSFGKAFAACLRLGLLTLLTSLWWIGGLWAEGKYGLPVIRYTETYRTVSEVSSAPEVLRGLGYWFFYGRDKLGPWVEPGVTYTEVVPTVALSYLLPILAITSAALLRWKNRLFFVILLVIGAFLAIASYPFASPSLVGSVFKAFTRTDSGLSLRSTPRAGPLVILAMAVFLGAGVSAIGRRLPKYSLAVSGLVCLLVVANLPTLWTGDMVASNLQRPEELPQYWNETAAYLDAQSHDTRILEVPGTDFASYRWGNTVDPITPGLTDRPYVARELFVWGAPASANLLNAYDRRFHEDTMDAAAVAPIAQVMASGSLLLRADLQYERFRTARPREMWELLNQSPGLDEPVAFGPTDPNLATPELPLIDEIELAAGHPTENPPAVSVFAVQNPVPIVRTHAAEQPLLVAGDGDGLVDAASLGLIDAEQGSFYSASFPTSASPEHFDVIYGQDADLMVTDTNRKRARRWGTLRETTGYTERVGENPLRWDPSDQRLEVFPGAGDDAYTVTDQIGGATVSATTYGNEVTYTPNDRAVNALDGDPLTAWRAADRTDPRGETLYIDLDQPISTDHITLLQPTAGPRNRWITRARLTFSHADGTTTVEEIDLGEMSHESPGQVVSFPEQEFVGLDIEVLATDTGVRPRYDGLSGVGFAEVGIEGIQVEELVRPPTDLLDRAGASSIDHQLSLLFTRLRSNPQEPVRTDEELAMKRIVTLPVARTYAVSGQARLSSYASEDTITTLITGRPATEQVTALSSEHLPGSIGDGGRSAIDGDPATAWSGGFSKTVGYTLSVDTPEPVTFDHLDLQVVTDGQHSVPTDLSLVVDGDGSSLIPIVLPEISPDATPSGITEVRVDLPAPVTGVQFRFTIDGATDQPTIDWYSRNTISMPVAIAELGIPGIQAEPLPAEFDTGCRSDLLTVDGAAVPLRVTGSTADAVARNALSVEICGSTGEQGLELDAGDHIVRTATGRDIGIDLDRLLLGSAAGGAALPVAEQVSDRSPAGPAVTVTHTGRVSYGATVDAAGAPFWIALGQSQSEGWTATANGESLGAPQLIDGYGNGWLVTPTGDEPVEIHMEWGPQRVVWVSIAISVIAVLACLALIIFGRRRRDVSPDETPVGGDSEPDHDGPVLALPWRTSPSAVSPKATVVTAVTLGLFALLTIPFTSWQPLVSIGVAGAVLVAYRSPRGRGWLGIGAAASLGLAATYIVVGQIRHQYEADFDWPIQFAKVNILGLTTLYLLLAEGLRGFLAPSSPSADSADDNDNDPAPAPAPAPAPGAEPPAPSRA